MVPATLNRRGRSTVIALAVALATAGIATASTRAAPPKRAVVAATEPDAPEPSHEIELPTTTVAPEPTTTSTTQTGATALRAPRAPRPPSTPRVAAPVVPKGDAGTGTIVDLPERGVWVFDTATGAARRVSDLTSFDVVGSTLYLVRGASVTRQPVAGSAESPTGIAGPGRRLEWLEMSSRGDAITQWSEERTPGVTYITTAMINATGRVMFTSQGVDGKQVEWSPDGSFFVLREPDGLRGYAANGTLKFGPVATPDQWPTDIDFLPDGKHLIIVFGHYKTFSFDVTTHAFASLPYQGKVSVADDGTFATTRETPPGWNGFNQLGTIIGDLSGGMEPLTSSSTEPTISPSATNALLLGFGLGIKSYDDQNNTMRLYDRTGKVHYTLAHRGMSFGRDEFRESSPHSDGAEGPRWSSDSRYVVVAIH